jgi:hypothetical protein
MCVVTMLAGVGWASVAGATDIPLTIAEPAGVTRVQEYVTSGVPLPAGTQTANWSLWNGAQEIPVQVTPLGGRTPWILLDFATDLPASGSRTLTLRDAPGAAQPQAPIVITEDATQIAVVTGPMRAVLRKDVFDLVEGVWLDRDRNGTFAAGEQLFGSNGGNIRVVDATSGTSFSGAVAPDKVVWEYRGPLRATLRVDGQFRSGSTTFLAYTTRLTFYAGQSRIRVDYLIRNSYRPNERQAKIRSATLQFGAGTATSRATRPGSLSYLNAGGGGVRFEAVPAVLWNIDTASNGGMLVPDLSYHGASFLLDCEEGVSSAEQTRRANAAEAKLFARAPADWYSEYGELTCSRFSTLDMERQFNQRVGWTWSPSIEPQDPHQPDYAMSWKNAAVHDDLEADDLWQNMVMFLRTGNLGGFDRAQGWARYYTWEYPLRTDGWSADMDPDVDIARAQRPAIAIPMSGADQSYLTVDVEPGRVDYHPWYLDHLFGWGLIDWYYLTGDVSAREAAEDLAELSERMYSGWTPGVDEVGGNMRRGARNLTLAVRVWECTQSSRWAALMNRIAQFFIQAPDWDSRGFYYYTDSSKPGARISSPIYLYALATAFDRYINATGSPEIRSRAIAIANFVKQYGLHRTWNYTGQFFALDYPSPGALWHDWFDTGDLAGFVPNYTIMLVSTLTLGYRLSGDATLLDRAKFHWDRGSKGQKGVPSTPLAGPTEVGKFVNSTILTNNVYYRWNGELAFTTDFFHDYVSNGVVDVTPPAPPANLLAR